MTNREILAELKKSYEYLSDIIENGSEEHCDGQLSLKLVNKLKEAKDNIEETYSAFYRSLKYTETEIPINKFNKSKTKGVRYFKIDSDIAGDLAFVGDDGNEYSATGNSFDYYWYEDEEFLTSSDLEMEM